MYSTADITVNGATLSAENTEAVVIEGKVVKVELTESKKAERIAASIAGEVLAFFNLFQQVNGSDMNFGAYHSATAERDYSCPKCGSYDVDAIWYDDEDVSLECADCKHSWVERIVPEAERIESVTAEEYPIALDDEEELVGEVYFDSDEQKFCVEIYENGESVHVDYFDSSDGVYNLIDALGEAFESISEDVVLKDTETGETEIVELVDGDVETSARTASRGRIAVEIATGKKVADYSNVFMDKVYAGDVYKDARGNEIEVVTAADDVTYIFSNWDEMLEDYRNEYRAMGKQAFLQFIFDNGYELR